ncbi:F0F1 ATP synthase subunit A [Candidatus Gracilibacteria bacterium]|nr:F0F1 ATP synthase subunit A [Candidatus Gracilibacteria bacterium]
MTTENQTNNSYDITDAELHDATGTEHAEGPHIPLIQGEQVYGPISNTSITTFIFLLIVIVVSLLANKALKTNKDSKLKTFFLHFVKFFDDQMRESFSTKKESRKYYALIVGMFSIILFGNLFGLIIDWFGMSVTPTLLTYMRPMHSDLNTTLVLSLITVVLMLVIQVRSQGAVGMTKSYLWNFKGDNIGMKLINVFVGWLHFLGLPATLASLSLRLFGNIFAGIVLIGVISYLMASATSVFFEAGRLLAIPFWFFEVFVALIQAIVFAFLMIAYFKQSAEHH